MHLLPAIFRQKLEDAGLSPTATDEEKALWAAQQQKLLRRVRYSAAAKAGAVIVIAGVTKFIRHPDMPALKVLATLGLGVALFGVLFGFFYLQSGSEAESERTKFIRARRMHQAILAEPDLEPDDSA